MSKIRNLPAKTTLDVNDLFYVVDSTVGANGGRKITTANVKSALSLTAAEVKSLYESNANTNAYTDAEKSKLAGIEAGATADQNASEVPYDNSTSGIAATNVKDALDELHEKADGGFNVSIDSGLIVHYTAGHVRVENTFYDVLAGDILLAANVTLGEIYVDVDGIVKQTGSGIKTPAGAYPIAIFSTNLTSVLVLTDARVRTNQNLVKAQLADVTSVSPDGAAAIGATNRYADAAHKHTIPTASAVGLDANSANGAGNADSVARSNHTHAIATAAPASQTPDQANAAGSSASLAKADHVHNIPTAAAVGLDANSANGQGAAATFARSNHTHAIATGAPSAQTPDQANAAGSSANLAKADHIHNIPTAAAVGLDANSANGQGAAATFARSNHTHAIATGAPSSQAPDQANAAGSSANLAKADHIHNIPTASAVSISTSTPNAQGAGANFAKADHTHAVSVSNQEATATADDTTTSATDTLMNSMTQTPAAGTYLAIWSGSILNSANGAERTWVSLYAGGSQVSATERGVGTAGGAYAPTSTQAVITVNGSQAIEIRWRAAGGTSTVRNRRLTLIKLS